MCVVLCENVPFLYQNQHQIPPKSQIGGGGTHFSVHFHTHTHTAPKMVVFVVFLRYFDNYGGNNMVFTTFLSPHLSGYRYASNSTEISILLAISIINMLFIILIS